jgi:peptide methionine sulfoxide reductase MsrA
MSKESKERINQSGKFDNRRIVRDQISIKYYKAEEYHQQYFQKSGLAH